MYHANAAPTIAPAAAPIAAPCNALLCFTCAKSFEPWLSDAMTEMSAARYPALIRVLSGLRNRGAIRIDTHYRCVACHITLSSWNFLICLCTSGAKASGVRVAKMRRGRNAGRAGSAVGRACYASPRGSTIGGPSSPILAAFLTQLRREAREKRSARSGRGYKVRAG